MKRVWGYARAIQGTWPTHSSVTTALVFVWMVRVALRLVRDRRAQW